VRASRLEAAIGTKARIYFKNEAVSPAGSHKPNTSIPQAYFNKQEGVRRIATETGAGQWGTALAFACRMFGVQCTVYMVRCSYDQKPYRGILIRAYGAEVYPSPSERTKFGRRLLETNPDTGGSLGAAISEAIEDALAHDDTKYALGSVLNHVLLHQTITGLETQKQLKTAGEKPDILIGCVGGAAILPASSSPRAGETCRRQGKVPGRGTSRLPHPHTRPVSIRFRRRGPGRPPLLKMHTVGHSLFPPSHSRWWTSDTMGMRRS